MATATSSIISVSNADKQTRQVIALDFDGIISGFMTFGKLQNGQIAKSAKQLQYCVRHAIDMLTWFDCDVYVITGDSSEYGRSLTSAMLANTKVKQIIFAENGKKLQVLHQKFGDLSNLIYCADDIHDILIAPQVGQFMTHKDAMFELKTIAAYVSEQDCQHYVLLDIAMHIVKSVLKMRPEWFVQTTTDNIWPAKLLTLFSINHIVIVGTEEWSQDKEELAFAWFDTMSDKLGITAESFKQSGSLIQYLPVDRLSVAWQDPNALAVLMPEAMFAPDLIEISKFKKVFINAFDDSISYDALYKYCTTMSKYLVNQSQQMMFTQTFLYMSYDVKTKLEQEQALSNRCIAWLRGSWCKSWNNEPVQTTIDCQLPCPWYNDANVDMTQCPQFRQTSKR